MNECISLLVFTYFKYLDMISWSIYTGYKVSRMLAAEKNNFRNLKDFSTNTTM